MDMSHHHPFHLIAWPHPHTGQFDTEEGDSMFFQNVFAEALHIVTAWKTTVMTVLHDGWKPE